MKSNNFWHGIAEEYPECCVDFFEYFWTRRAEIGMFSGRPEIYDWHIDGLDYDLGPDCVVKMVSAIHFSVSSSQQ